MRERILAKVEESFQKAEKFYGRKFSRPANIIFKTTGTTAGHCAYHNSELMFQITIAEREGDAFINRTPAHEVAHWIDFELHGYRKKNGRWDLHGERWKYIMERVMRQEASRCHSYDTTGIAIRRNRLTYEYLCSNGHVLKVSSVIHNRMVKGRKYNCRCGGHIQLKSQVEIQKNQNELNTLTNEIERLKKQLLQLNS